MQTFAFIRNVPENIFISSFSTTGSLALIFRIVKCSMMNFKCFIIIAALITALECSRILVLFPTISKSHIIPLQTLSVALANKGHEITFVSTYPLGKDVKNYRDVKIPFEESEKKFLDRAIKENTGNSIGLWTDMVSLLVRITNDTMQMEEMRRMMHEEKFDLVIVGYFFLTE